MRNIYLIRHGHPAFPIGSRICLGQTDTPLGPLGHLQGVLLAKTFSETPLIAVYTSPLKRATETAYYISASPIIKPGLSERATALWDGLSFDEIARQWPEIYKQRGKDPTVTMPGGEDLSHAESRFINAFTDILHGLNGDIAVIAHKGVIETFLRTFFKSELLSKLPYGAYWHLIEEQRALFLKETTPFIPHPLLDESLCHTLLETVAPTPVIQHCEAVKTLALEIAAQLPLTLDTSLIEKSALLHDIARSQPDHARTGAQWLKYLGYPEVANIIRQHHDLDSTKIDEASIVYIADKCLKGTEQVPLQTRFAASRAKCQTPEALSAWNRRWQTTVNLQKSINNYCRKEIIQ